MRKVGGLSVLKSVLAVVAFVVAAAVISAGLGAMAALWAVPVWGVEASKTVLRPTAVVLGISGTVIGVLFVLRQYGVVTDDDWLKRLGSHVGRLTAPWRSPLRKAMYCLLSFLLAFSLLGNAFPAWGDEVEGANASESLGAAQNASNWQDGDSSSDSGNAGAAAGEDSPSNEADGPGDEDVNTPASSDDAGENTSEPDEELPGPASPTLPEVEPSNPVDWYDEPDPEGELVAVDGDAAIYQLSNTQFRTVIGGPATAYVDEDGEPQLIDNTLVPTEASEDAPPVLLSLFAAESASADVSEVMNGPAPDALTADEGEEGYDGLLVLSEQDEVSSLPGTPLIEVPVDSTVYEPVANGFDLQLPAAMAQGRGLVIQKDGHRIELIPQGGDFTHSAIRDNAIRYTAVRPNVDYQYTLVGGVVKEDIVLTGPAEPFIPRMRIEVEGDLEVVQEGGVVVVRQRAEEGGEPGEEIISLAAPIAIDAAEEVDNTLALQLVQDVDGCSVAEVVANWDWLNAPERAYPVRIDPAIDIASTAMRLTSVEQLSPNMWVGENNYQYSGYDDGVKSGTGDSRGGKGLGITRVYLDIRYDFGNIMDEARIDRAELSLHQRTRYSGGATKFGLYRNKNSWDFTTITWNKQTFMNHEFIQFKNANTAKGYVTWDVREAVNNWVQGIWPQYGFCVKAEDERNMQCELFDHRYSGNPPTLEIDWTVPDPVSESTSLNATTVNLRPVTEVDIDGKLQLDGVFADGIAKPKSTVAYSLTVKNDAGSAYASRSYKYPDTSAWESVLPNGTKYRNKLSNWQSKLFTGLAFNTEYKVQARASADGATGALASSDRFLVYKASARDTMPYIAAHYGVSTNTLMADNRVQDSLVVGGNTIFVRNPKTTTAYSPGPLTDDQKRRIDSALMGRGKHCEYGFEPINLNTGNFILEATDATVTEIEGDFAIQRTYNAKGGGYSSSFGRNWSFAWDESLGIEASKAVAYVEGDGKTRFFDPDGSGGYRGPEGEGLSLQRIAYKEGSATKYRWEITESDGTVRRFDKWGMLSEVVAPTGAVTTVQRDAAGRLTALVSPTGVRYSITCDSDGRITAVVLPNGAKLAYAYNAAGDLVSFVDSMGHTVRYEYDASGRLTAWYNKNGHRVVSNTYDSAGRVIKQVDMAGRVNTLAYGPGFTRTMDAAGRITTYHYDSSYRTTSIEYPDGQFVTRVYGANNSLVSDENGTYSYDERGNCVAATSPDGHVTQWTYDAQNRITSQTDPDGAVTTYAYDAQGNLVSASSPASGTTEYRYDNLNRLVSMTDADGVAETYAWSGANLVSKTTAAGVFSYAYDAMGNQVSEVDPLGNTARTVYDLEGRVIGEQDAVGGYTSYQLDAMGLVLAMTDVDGYSTAFTYDAAYNISSMIDAAGGVTRYAYDAAGNKLTQIDPSGAVTAYAYDVRNRLISETDPLGNTTRYAYDSRGNLTHWEGPDGAVETAVYDNTHGVPLSVTDAVGSTTSYEYDAAGRLTATIYADGRCELATWNIGGLQASSVNAAGGVTSYSYSAAGRPVSVDDQGREWEFTYDAAGRIDAAAGPGGYQVFFAYDADGNLVSMADDLGILSTWTYDGTGRVLSETNALGAAARYRYDGRGNVVSVTDQAGATATYAYDEFGALVSATDALGNAITCKYDLDGNPISVTDARGYTRTAVYDAVGNMIEATDALGNATSYTYDAAGRTTSRTRPDGATETLEYDAVGNLVRYLDTAGRSTKSEYDQRGNVVSLTDAAGRTWAFEYDAEGNLTSAVDPVNRHAHFTYDAWGQETEEIGFDGSAIRRDYNERGNVTRETNAVGQSTSYEWDNRGNLVGVTREADGAHTAYTYDVCGNLTALTDALGNLQRWEYGDTGRVSQSVDQEGNTTRYEYDVLGRLVLARDPLGHQTEFEWDANGNLAASVNAVGSRNEWRYDGENRVVAHIDPLGNEETWEYDAVGNVVATTDLAASRTVYAYDVLGNVLSEIDPLGQTTAYEYDGAGNVTARTTAEGNRWEYKWDALDRLTAVITPRGYMRQLGYDDAGNAVLDADNMGLQTAYAYDALHRMISQTNAGGATTQWEYDAAGNLSAEIDAAGARTEYAYDALGRMLSRKNSLGQTTRWAWDARGNLISQSGTNVDSMLLQWDAAGNLTSLSDLLGNATQFEWDAAQRLAGEVSPSGSRTTYSWDAADNLVASTDSLGRVASWKYDAMGRTTEQTDRNGNATTYEWDAVGQLTSVTSAGGEKTTYGYDADENLTKVVDALGRATTYGYDGEGDLVSISSPSGAQEQLVRDAAGQVTATIDAGGNVTRYDWDKLGNLVQKGYSQDSSQAVRYAYDAAGQLIARSDATGEASLEYDSVGRVVAETDGEGRRLEYAYNELGQLASVVYPDGTRVAYSYDDAGNLTTVGTPSGDYSYTYNEDGQPATLKRPDGTRTEYRYNAEGQLVRLDNLNPQGSAISWFAYDWDGEGNPIVEESEALGADGARSHVKRTYAYDANNRLASFKEQPINSEGELFEEAYEWDPAGNRTAVVHADLATGESHRTQFVYDDDDKLVESVGAEGRTIYTYDAAGNLVEKNCAGEESIQYAYTVENRLAAVRQGGRVLMAATYDGDGNRVFQTNLYVANESEQVLESLLPAIADVKGEAEGDGFLLGGLPATGQLSSASDVFAEEPYGESSVSLMWWAAGLSLSGSIMPANLPLGAFAMWLIDLLVGGGSPVAPGQGLPAPPSWDALLAQSGLSHDERYMAIGEAPALSGGSLSSPVNVIPADSLFVQDRWELVAYVNSSVMGDVSQTLWRQSNVLGDVSEVYGLSRLATLGGASQDGTEVYLNDGLGSVSAVLSSTGAVEASYSYAPWGTESQVVSGSGSSSVRFQLPHYGYNAEEEAPSANLQYLHARWYDSAMASFGSADSYLGDVWFPATLNRYAYGEGNPVANADPSGHIALPKTSTKIRNTIATVHKVASVQKTATYLATSSSLAKAFPSLGKKAQASISSNSSSNILRANAQKNAKQVASSSGSSSSVSSRAVGKTARKVVSSTKYGYATNTAQAVAVAACEGTSFMSAVSSSSGPDWAAIGHGALDLLGFVPGLGAAADVANGIWYAAEGNYVDAAMSFASAVPGIGDAVGSAKMGAKAAKAGFAVADEAVSALKAPAIIKSNKAGTLRAEMRPDGSVDLILKKKDGWGNSQIKQAKQKAKDITKADIRIPEEVEKRGNKPASQTYKDAYGNNAVPTGYDVDHIVDLQLGGKDTLENMRPLDRSVNRSMGAQIQYLIKDLKPGTVIGQVRFG